MSNQKDKVLAEICRRIALAEHHITEAKILLEDVKDKTTRIPALETALKEARETLGKYAKVEIAKPNPACTTLAAIDAVLRGGE